jgi:hypothetical protein
MNLECLDDIIRDNLAIYIDLTNIKSWKNWNTGLTAFSLTKWSGAFSDNINLMDFGLTGFDNGRTNVMWTGFTLTSTGDTYLSMYRVGENIVQNPTTGETSGITVTTSYSGYSMSATTVNGGSLNYFDAKGGYLQGFFKLKDYNYNIFPSRYNGITIETLMYLHPDSHGIFFMMGTRAEDKYNSYFSGETTIGITSGTTTGVITSLDNHLDAFATTQVLKKAFINFENRFKTDFIEEPAANDINGNVIAFELTQDKRIAYKYIDNKGHIITDTSPAIIKQIGFTIIDISYIPTSIILDPLLLECSVQRMGKLIVYVNGRAVWIIHDFPEFYFKPFNNDKEKQLGVPYSISWGGGSFGLKHSYHYDYQTYILYNGQDSSYVNSNFSVQGNPISIPTNDNYLVGLSLSADTSGFTVNNVPYEVMCIGYTGETGTTTGKTYFVKFDQPVSVLSNRDYEVNLSIFDDEFFKTTDVNGNPVHNKISLLVYSDDVDVDILNDIEYRYPLSDNYLSELTKIGLYPFPDRQEFQYIRNGIMYYGKTGLQVLDQYSYLFGYGFDFNYNFNNMSSSYQTMYGTIVTGQNGWKPIKSTFRIKDNTGQQFVNIGLLIETDDSFNLNKPLFVTNFTYTAADILVQDERKKNLTIEQNFDNSFIGGIQKLRIYNKTLTYPEILHNALIEAKKYPELNLIISNGGRIINQLNNTNLTQQTAGSDIRKSIKYRNIDNTYKNLSEMIDIKVVVKSKINSNIELVKFKKVAETGWLALIKIDDFTYDFIVSNTITSAHPNEMLYAEIKFQWTDPNDINNVIDKIFIVNLSTSTLLDNTIKNY